MKNYNSKIVTLFRDEMVLSKNIENSRSKSPLKPQKLIEFIHKNNMDSNFTFYKNFKKYTKSDFYAAHTKEYVDKFFKGVPDAVEYINIPWSKEMSEVVKWTNSALYNAIKYSILNPKDIVLAPTSGFHHATPTMGMDFCPFSGQVIASSKLYGELDVSGCYIDLDAHFGNSIEDSRSFVSNLNQAIPKGFNINPVGFGEDYMKSLSKSLIKLKNGILDNKIHYVVLCHGADSHIDDDLKAGVLTTEQWLECSKMVYRMLEETSEEMGKNIPLTLSLFGGYRNDDYDFVLDLHLQSILNSIK